MIGLFKVLVGVLLGVGGYISYNIDISDGVPTLEEKWWGDEDRRPYATDEVYSAPIGVPLKIILDLNARLDYTRYPNTPLEGVQFQYGFNSETLQKVVKFWRHNYDWRAREKFFNKYPMFRTNVQGLDIHFLHVKPKTSTNESVIPLMLLHGWPGSIREFYKLIDHLDSKDLSFEIIVPSLPGFGFSSPPTKPGLGAVQIADVLAKLMMRLGYKSWFVHGGDWGSQIASHMAILHPDKVLGIHLNFCISNTLKTYIFTFLASIYPSLFMEERFVQKMYPLSEKITDRLTETGFLHLQATKPDTIGAVLADSPAGLAAYILEKFSTGTNSNYRSFPDGGLTEKFTYTELLDNIMLYWITSSMTSSMRLYAESFSKENRALGFDSLPVKVPTWCARFPGEMAYQPDWMLRHKYPNLVKATDMKAGGHFAAMEVPDILAEDIKEAIRSFLNLK